jgi:hypothetical protein
MSTIRHSLRVASLLHELYIAANADILCYKAAVLWWSVKETFCTLLWVIPIIIVKQDLFDVGNLKQLHVYWNENRMDTPVTSATSACDLNGHNATHLNQRLVVIFVRLFTENVYDRLRLMMFMNTKCDSFIMYITSIVHYVATGIGMIWINPLTPNDL